MIYNTRDVLIYFSNKYKQDYKKITDALKAKEKIDQDLLDQYKSQIKSNYVCLLDDNYPEILKNVPCPPLVLYYYGNFDLINSRKKLAVIGTRTPSNYATRITKKLVSETLINSNNEVTILSGMAYGVDSIAQKEAIKNCGKVISILGSGIDLAYPESSLDIYNYCKETNNGLVISEYIGLEEPKKEHFPIRNRIISMLANCLLVIEGKEKSGTSITTRYALDFGKDILAVPNEIDSPYSLTNSLIASGANICQSYKDILSLLCN